MTLKSEAKFERKLIYCVKNGKNLVTFDSSTHASKLGLWWDPFVQSRICISVKFTEELCARTMNNDTKFEEELTCRFKIDMTNLTNFDPNTGKSRKFVLWLVPFVQSI